MATTYIHFTEEQKDQARRTDLRSFLLGQGEKVERSGSEYKWNHGGEKSRSGEIYGLISMNQIVEVVMLLPLSENFMVWIFRRRYSSC